jgi:hypothetical protein
MSIANKHVDSTNISKSLKLFCKADDFPECHSDEDLLKTLSIFIEQLLNSNPERLWQIFYRLDIDEQKVKQALADRQQHLNFNIGIELAKLVIEREKLRLYYRNLYSSE